MAPASRTAVIEHASGYVIVVWLGDDTALLVLAQSSATLGPLVEDLRRYRERITALV
jgi:predicted regulator of Ras-like GTPase activity (Roadblock/LC7/MglB family)